MWNFKSFLFFSQTKLKSQKRRKKSNFAQQFVGVDSIHLKQKVTTTQLKTEYVEQRLSSCVFVYENGDSFDR